MSIRKYFGWSLPLIFLAVLTVSCRGQGTLQVAEFSDQEQELATSITIVNWNAQKGKKSLFSEDLRMILKQELPDIVFLQEAKSDFFSPQQMGGYLAEGWSYPWQGGQTIGVLTLSRVSPVWILPVPTKYREFGVTAPKISLVMVYPLPNGEHLMAVNVHLLNFERRSIKKISHQLEDLKAIMAEHAGPIIMAGDFNTWNQKRLQLVQTMVQEIQLEEATGFPEGRKTGDRNSEFWNKALGIDEDLPLDRFYYRGFKLVAARVLSFNSSDHTPMLVSLELNP